MMMNSSSNMKYEKDTIYEDNRDEKIAIWDDYRSKIQELYEIAQRTDDLDLKYLQSMLRVYGECYNDKTIDFSKRAIQGIDKVVREHESSFDNNNDALPLRDKVVSILDSLLREIDDRRAHYHMSKQERQRIERIKREKVDEKYEDTVPMNFLMTLIVAALASINIFGANVSFRLSSIAYSLVLLGTIIAGFMLISNLPGRTKFHISGLALIIGAIGDVLAIIGSLM